MPYRSRLEVTIDSKSGETRLRRLQYELDRTEKAGALVGKSILALGGALAGALTINAVGRLATMADEFALLQSRVRAATDATGDYVSVSERLFDISQDTGTTLRSNIELFDRIRIGAQELGRSNTEILEFVEAINQLGQIGGSSATELQSAAIQLSQSLSGGIVRAEEFNSIIENTPRLAQAIAEGLGRSTGELRNMMLSGELLADDVFESILGQTDKIERDFGKLETTIERAGTTFGNSFDLFIGRLNEATQASSNVARIIEGLASGLDNATEMLFGAADPIENLSDKIQDLVEERFKLVFLLRQEQEAGSVAALATQSRIDAIDREVKSLDDRRKALVQQRIAQDDATRAAEEAAAGGGLKPPEAKDIQDAQDLRASLDKRFAIELQYRRRIEEINDLYNKRALDADTKAELERKAELARIRSQSAGNDNSYDSILGGLDAQSRGQEIIAAQQAEFEATRQHLDKKYAIEQRYQQQVQALRDGRRNNQITTDAQFNQLQMQAEQEKKERLLEINGSYWDQYLAAARESLTSFDELASSATETFSRQFGSAFESVIFDSQTAGDAFHDMAEGLVRSFVNALGQMLAQWAAYQAVQLALGQSSQAAAAAGATATAATISAAFATPAALVSLASFGANSAPAIAGIAATTAFSQGVSLLGQAHDGIDNVPNSGTWNLEKGERVTGKALNRDLTQFLDNENRGKRQAANDGLVVNINEDASKAGQVERRTDDDGTQSLAVWVSNVNSDGIAAKTLEQTYGLTRQGT